MSMDAGGLAQMTYNNNNFVPGGLGAPGSGYAARGGGRPANLKRLSVALPPKVNPIHEEQVDNPTPRTSRSHLLAGLRTQPKGNGTPASAPYTQSQHQFGRTTQYNKHSYDGNNQMGGPHTANGTGFDYAQYGYDGAAANNGYGYPASEQVLAPPSFYGQDDGMDPTVLEQLQLTGAFLAQRQQQLQQQLASITAAASQFPGMGLDASMFQQSTLPMQYGQQSMYLQQQMDSAVDMPASAGLFVMYNQATGNYEYVTDDSATQQAPKKSLSGLARASTLPNVSAFTPDRAMPTPTFRAEISPPPQERSNPSSRSITPPKKASTPPAILEHVEPLPPPSANAFRRNFKKAPSANTVGAEPPKTASAATFGSARFAIPPTPMTGTFGPGAARAGEHPIRQPRGPPPLEELVASPTSKHEGSKNFAARQRRMALNNLMRAGSFRRSNGSSGSPVSEREFILNASEEDEPGMYRKQSPIGSERNSKRGSQDSLDGLGSGNSTPASETGNMFDMGNFVKALPSNVQQGQERRKMMLGVLNAAEKRKSVY